MWLKINCMQRFLSGVAFSICKVVHVAWKWRGWLILFTPQEKPLQRAVCDFHWTCSLNTSKILVADMKLTCFTAFSTLQICDWLATWETLQMLKTMPKRNLCSQGRRKTAWWIPPSAHSSSGISLSILQSNLIVKLTICVWVTTLTHLPLRHT